MYLAIQVSISPRFDVMTKDHEWETQIYCKQAASGEGKISAILVIMICNANGSIPLSNHVRLYAFIYTELISTTKRPQLIEPGDSQPFSDAYC